MGMNYAHLFAPIYFWQLKRAPHHHLITPLSVSHHHIVTISVQLMQCERDTELLRSLHIMDYSLLLGVHSPDG